MKKLFLLFSLAIIATSAYTQSALPNGGMENWYNVSIPALGVNYDDLGTGPTDNWLTSLNALNAIPPPIGPARLPLLKPTINIQEIMLLNSFQGFLL